MIQKLHKPLFFYFFFGAVWLFLQIVSGNLGLSFDPACQTSEAFSYTESAKMILSGNYPWFRAIGYPLILAPFMYLFGLNGTIVFITIFQFFAWLFTLRLLYKTLILLETPKQWSLITTLIYSFFISPVLSTNHLLTESFYQMLLLLSIYLFCGWVKDKQYPYIYWIFPVLVLSALIRPLGLNFFYASFLLVLIQLFYNQFKSILFFGLAFLMLSAHLFLMNKYHHTTQICLSKNHALYHYLFMKVSHYPDMNATAYEKAYFENSEVLDSQIAKHPQFLAHRDSIYAAKNKMLFKKNKYATLKTMYVNFKDEITGHYSNHNHARQWVYWVSKIQHIFIICCIPLMFIGFIWMISKSKPNGLIFWWWLVSLGITLYICLGSSLVFWYGDRLHLPFYPLVIMSMSLALRMIFKPRANG